ncbi:prenyltransferase/squalene oxidase repeat-containing protein [Aeoliella mucimassa]|uniref:Pectic acid lyase n=1 Tax=Aeoliella mucimassa TaxID=2527972 RepID=A0A518AW30_9BACT|nr:prenyltransferase/squalene oxidase repeat-containing protein [Aeoliella mucimassa]QDU58901.1 Pectic acid lyase [Aeoliella mucimassa]
MPTKQPTADAPTLDPGVDACACPDCGMPMSVRLWLRTADCLRCGTSISLEYLPIAPSTAKANSRRKQASEQATPAPQLTPQSALPSAVAVDDIPLINVTAPPRIASRAKQLMRSLHQLLACLMSILAHLLMLLLLAILGWGSLPVEDPAIELSVVFDKDEREGDELSQSIQTVGFEVPLEDVDTPEEQEAERWAKDLAIEDPADAPNLPPLDRVADRLVSNNPYDRMLSARDPRIRQKVLEAEGGTNLTEAAVAKALRWLALHQNNDGSWSLDRFDHAGECNGRCHDRASMHSDEGATALALQAMLGAGQTHRTGIYRDTVSHGLQYLLFAQSANGSLATESDRNAGMYSHALATIALADAYALTGDEMLHDPAQRAVNFLVHAQHSAGGWRYVPGERGDLSVTGWQLMALHSARAAGLRVEPGTLAQASRFLDQVQTDRIGSMYAYQPGQRDTPAMTAEGLLSRIYLGWKQDEPGLREGVRELVRRHPVNHRQPNIYYWYYGTQLVHHWGGREWRTWNEAMSDALVTSQVRVGHAAGSWDPNTPHGGQGGRLYMTVLATCTLEVYYRHAPLFRKIKLD